MAYVLSLPSTNPLERPFTNPLGLRSCSSLASQASLGTARHHTPQSDSAASTPNGAQPKTDENVHPRLVSRSLLSLIHDLNSTTPPGPLPDQIPPQTSWCRSRSPSSAPGTGSLRPLQRKTARLREDCRAKEGSPTPRISTDSDELDPVSAPRPSEAAAAAETVVQDITHVSDQDDQVDELDDHQEEGEESLLAKSVPKHLPFKRWLSTLRRKNQQRHKDIRSHLLSADFAKLYRLPPLESPRQHSLRYSSHRQSLSLTSSLGLLTTVKSASMTLTATSLATKSRAGTRSARLVGDNKSTRFSEMRMSFESTAPSFEPVIDEKAWARSVQRRKIVEELLCSEENYIVDMKALVNVRTKLR